MVILLLLMTTMIVMIMVINNNNDRWWSIICIVCSLTCLTTGSWLVCICQFKGCMQGVVKCKAIAGYNSSFLAINFPSASISHWMHVNHEPTVSYIDIILSFSFSKPIESLSHQHPFIRLWSTLMTLQIAWLKLSGFAGYATKWFGKLLCNSGCV